MGGLLDLDPSLVADGLPGAAGEAAAVARVPFVTIPPGPWSPDAVPDGFGRPFAMLVADCLLVHHLWLSQSGSSELLGPGDLISPRETVDPLVPMRHSWHVAARARIGLLDGRLAGVLAAAPLVGARLLARAAEQQARASAHRAIVGLPHLAERWGRVGTAGLVVPLALTHEAIGHLVGARRPTVSLGLKTLAEEDLLGRRGDGSWLITTSALDRLTPAGPQTGDFSAVAVAAGAQPPPRRVRRS
jgi:CRP/FNR family transcriptional regulator, cyclic AMP receptor protein